VHVVQTDNGAEFQTQFHWHLERKDIRHVYIRPRTPHLNGKVERSHRIDDHGSHSALCNVIKKEPYGSAPEIGVVESGARVNSRQNLQNRIVNSRTRSLCRVTLRVTSRARKKSFLQIP
jgi:hypothetical protein